MSTTDTSTLFAEVWAEYGISICTHFLRFYARWKLFGFKNFDIGDAFAGLAMIFYTLETVGIYLLTSYGNNIGLNEETAMAVPDNKIADLTLGSKLAFMNWKWYISLIWCLKGVLLTIYVKLGTGVARQELVVKFMCLFTLSTWIACILTHTLICIPAHKSWQIKPYAGDNCTVRKPNYIVIAVLNSLTDMGIIMVPMPLLFKVKVPLKQKIALILLFSLGFFVIVATILRAYYSLKSLDTLMIALGWASRETFVATIVACAPGIKPLFSSQRWKWGTSDHSGNKSSSKYYHYGLSGKGTGSAADPNIHVSRSVDVYTEHGKASPYDFEMGKWRGNRPASSTESDERVMIGEDQSENKGDADNRSGALFSAEHVVKPKAQV
ncbi:hypothetical protein M409DRAFT_30052 [Zasmidium cellare ATCC 36951]|uniref:Rhodopsin domain-containing protein n=1 Tax=Zasmidium cellare ATCC 36951 TaxID=1080233 RepID=A0A6A6BX76_ZASCE|nr:uncharacterized protein M409DRAFT_30052 [Zasmidium cellare ATCC 36951]KAF2159434.1 hypothetical protein M409DRAFT_30052 [Zasmidium cellare ATCC 36951]